MLFYEIIFLINKIEKQPMMSYLLYYNSDEVYQTILNRIQGFGYKLRGVNEGKDEIEVSKWFFPFIKRKFNIGLVI